jgi:hypothetical protein
MSASTDKGAAMLKRSKVVALSKSAIQRVAAGKAGVIPANKRHLKELEELKRHKHDLEARKEAKRA